MKVAKRFDPNSQKFYKVKYFFCSICWFESTKLKSIQTHMAQAHTKRTHMAQAHTKRLDQFLEEIR